MKRNLLKKKKFITLSRLFILPTFLIATPAFSAGLEKAVMFSGHYAGIGGTAASSVSGPEALYFNPAGLGKSQTFHATANFSPTFSQFTAPISGIGSVSSERSFSPIGSLFTSLALTPQLGVGLGYYVSGGTKAIYNNLDFGATFPALKPTLKSDVSISEFSLGAGYEVFEDFYVGAAYRIVIVKADLGLARVIPGGTPSLLAFNLNDLSATRYNGFRLGAQYAPKDARWGVGAQWRSSINFTAEGNTSGSIMTAGSTTATALPGSAATASATFPYQISVAGHYDVLPNRWRAFAGYDFTEYHANQTLDLTGSLSPTLALQPVSLNWNNMNNLRVATEYQLMESLALRAGYVFTSQVVPNSSALPTFSSPGNGHTFTVGAGYRLLNNLTGDVALEYSTASGTVSATDGATPGDYSSNAYAAHLGLSYQM